MVSQFLVKMAPLFRTIPTIAAPKRKVLFREKMFWTIVVLVIFLACSQIPLYGLGKSIKSDPLYWLRVIFASNRGTLMELGIGPSFTTGLVMQLLVGSGLLSIDMSKEDERALFNSAQKFFGIILTFAQAVLYMFFGMYGSVAELGYVNAGIIIAQLTVTGFIVSLLDEMLTNGWGIGSGANLFIATNVCENIIWKTFSVSSMEIGYGKEYEGALIALIHALWTNPNKLEALQYGFTRSSLPNVTNLLATVLIFGVGVYFQGFRAEIALQREGVTGPVGSYPIKLFYNGNTPILFQNAINMNIMMVSQMLARKFAGNLFVNMLGTWEESGVYTGQSYATGGIAYLLSAPTSIKSALVHPFHFAFYTVLTLSMCGLISYLYCSLSRNGPRDVATQLRDQKLRFSGYSRFPAIVKRLSIFIIPASVLGGVIIGAISIAADMLGAIGSGTGILLATTTLASTIEEVLKEGRFFE